MVKPVGPHMRRLLREEKRLNEQARIKQQLKTENGKAHARDAFEELGIDILKDDVRVAP